MTPRIHHVLVAMPRGGEDAARAYYGDLLGFPEIAKPASLMARGGVWFQTSNLQLHLGVDAAFIPASKAHIAYEVEGLHHLRSRLLGTGIGITDDEPLPGYDRFYIDDPFGNRIELLEPLP